jgi:hypothetical protein
MWSHDPPWAEPDVKDTLGGASRFHAWTPTLLRVL